MFSRIDLTLAPSGAVGLIASAPWLVLLLFVGVTAGSGKPWLLLLLPAVCLGAVAQYRSQGLLQGRRAVTGLQLKEQQLYACVADRLIPVSALGVSRIGPCLTLLKLRPAGTRFSGHTAILFSGVSMLAGNVPESEFRRLRVWLRLNNHEATAN